MGQYGTEKRRRRRNIDVWPQTWPGNGNARPISSLGNHKNCKVAASESPYPPTTTRYLHSDISTKRGIGGFSAHPQTAHETVNAGLPSNSLRSYISVVITIIITKPTERVGHNPLCSRVAGAERRCRECKTLARLSARA